MSTFWQDIRYGVRMLIKAPGFTIIALLTLALGIAATTAIFTIVDAVLLRKLPINDPSRVVVIHNQLPKVNLPRTQVSAPQYIDYSREANAASKESGGQQCECCFHENFLGWMLIGICRLTPMLSGARCSSVGQRTSVQATCPAAVVVQREFAAAQQK